MKTLQTYLSALVDLFFPRFDPEKPDAIIPPRPWGELIGISFVLLFLILLMTLTS